MRGEGLDPRPPGWGAGLGQDGLPQMPACGHRPRETCSFCFPTVPVFSWAPTEAQREVWQPAFPSEGDTGCPSGLWSPQDQADKREAGPGPQGISIKKDREGPRDSLSRFPKRMLLHLEGACAAGLGGRRAGPGLRLPRHTPHRWLLGWDANPCFQGFLP